MDAFSRQGAILFVLLSTPCGCAIPDRTDPFASRDAAEASRVATARREAPGTPAATPMGGVNSSASSSPDPPANAALAAPDPRALANVVAEFDMLDEAAQAQLMEDLKQTDPALWPQLLSTFRAAAAYRRQNAAGRSPAVSATTRPLANQLATTAHRPTMAQNAGPPNDRVAQPPFNPLRSADLAQPAGHGGLAHAFGSSASEPVQQASFEQDDAGNWKNDLETAIRKLQQQTGEPPRTAEEVARHAHLRMLYLAADRRDDALRPIPGISAAQQDFWTAELFGLATWLDAHHIAATDKRAAEAAIHLNQARARLAELSTLVVRNLNFCTEVSSYGVYNRFKTNEFKPGQQALLYAEIDNFKSESTAKGHHTALKSSYQILDIRGQRVTEHEFPVMEEYCQNARRDFFISYLLHVPERIYDGRYTLQLTVEDTLGQKLGQSTIDFTVKP